MVCFGPEWVISRFDGHIVPAPPRQGGPPIGEIKTLEEVEAEMSRTAISQPSQPKVLTLAEIEQQMMAAAEPTPRVPLPPVQPEREATPVQAALSGSGYASQQAFLDSMFPELGKAPSTDRPTAAFPPGMDGRPVQPSGEERIRMEAMHERISAKIQAMSRNNNLMGSSDKDFITRIQLSQLASADPYTSDFYALVFSALKRNRIAEAGGDAEGPSVVEVARGFGMGVGAAGNRFGKMGTNTMQKLSTQVKKLVENRAQHQKAMNSGE